MPSGDVYRIMSQPADVRAVALAALVRHVPVCTNYLCHRLSTGWFITYMKWNGDLQAIRKPACSDHGGTEEHSLSYAVRELERLTQ